MKPTQIATNVKYITGGGLVVVLLIYTLIVLYPSYQSGVYLLSIEEIQSGNLSVPFYSSDTNPRLEASVPAITTILASYLIPIFSLTIILSVYFLRNILSRRSKWTWIGFAVFSCITFYLSYPIANRLISWAIDWI